MKIQGNPKAEELIESARAYCDKQVAEKCRQKLESLPEGDFDEVEVFTEALNEAGPEVKATSGQDAELFDPGPICCDGCFPPDRDE